MQYHLPHEEFLKLSYALYFSGSILPPNKFYPDYSLLLVDTGRDYKVCKRSFKRFIDQACQTDIKYKVIEYPEGVHRFDIKQNTVASKTVIKKMLQYVQKELK